MKPDRDATCAWDCQLPEGHSGDCSREPGTLPEGIECIACGTKNQGGYEVEDGPGPFCAECWERLAAHFVADGAAQERARTKELKDAHDRTVDYIRTEAKG